MIFAQHRMLRTVSYHSWARPQSPFSGAYVDWEVHPRKVNRVQVLEVGARAGAGRAVGKVTPESTSAEA